MDALLLAPRFDGHVAERGPSFEDQTFGHALRGLGWRVEHFDDVAEARAHGVSAMNRRLTERVRGDRPTLLFAVLRRALVHRRTIRAVTQGGQTRTFNWYCDDHWQFETVSRRWTPCFGLVGTTSAAAYPRYGERGWSNVIQTQWAADPSVFRPVADAPACDVAFVGQPYGGRGDAVRALRDAGIDARGFGAGWPGGRLSREAMVAAMAGAKLVLNFAGSSVGGFSAADRFLRSSAAERVARAPVGWRAIDLARSAAVRRRASRGGAGVSPGPAQVKARVFEAAACGSCLVTEPAEDFASLLAPGREAVLFRNRDELLWACRSLLGDEAGRAAMARAGRERVLREHTWAHRLAKVFERLGLDRASEIARKRARGYAAACVGPAELEAA